MSEQCRLCGLDCIKPLFSAESRWGLLHYYECPRCNYVQTQHPTWLASAYEVPINKSDTGIMTRNLVNAKNVISTLSLLGSLNERVVDCAAGYGILVRLLRDKGIDAYWSDRYSENLLSKGFEYHDGTASLVTAFEAFEHFVDPLAESQKLLSISSNILISTTLIPSPAPKPSTWWYYGLEHGQHIGFFRIKSLQFIASQLGLNLLTDNQSVHLFSKNQYSPLIWRLLRIATRIHPSILTHRLTSKTMSDHHKLSM